MFGNDKKPKKRVTKIDSLIGRETTIEGDILFNGVLHIDGRVKGNITARDGEDSVLTLSEQGHIEGEIRVPNVVLNGEVRGDVYATVQVELAVNARVNGNVYYALIAMAMGAEVNGNLVHSTTAAPKSLAGSENAHASRRLDSSKRRKSQADFLEHKSDEELDETSKTDP